MTQFRVLFLLILAVDWKLFKSERRLAVDKGFYPVIQDILQVEEVILSEDGEVS